MATMYKQVKDCCGVKTNKFFLSLAEVMRIEWFNLLKRSLGFVYQKEWKLLGRGRPSRTTGQIWWNFGRGDGAFAKGQHLRGTTTWLLLALRHQHDKNHCVLLFSAFSLSHDTLPDSAFPAKLRLFNSWVKGRQDACVTLQLLGLGSSMEMPSAGGGFGCVGRADAPRPFPSHSGSAVDVTPVSPVSCDWRSIFSSVEPHLVAFLRHFFACPCSPLSGFFASCASQLRAGRKDAMLDKGRGSQSCLCLSPMPAPRAWV